MVSFEELYINFEVVSLFRQAWVFSEIHLSSPDLFVGIRPNGTTNLAEFVKLQQTFADWPKSWSVDAKTIDPATFDLSGSAAWIIEREPLH